VQVPDITNQSLSQAIQMLEESNLVLGGQTTVGGRSIPDSEKVVITQTPAAYSTTESGSRVSVLVGTREDYTNYFNPTPVPPQVQIMPQLVGKNMTEAYTLLSKVGIKHINTSSIGSSEANALDPRKESQWDSIYIIQQSIAAGSDFTTDTVDVVYGSKQDYQNFLNPTPIPTDPTTPPTTIPPNTDPDPDSNPDD
ncbi:MAG: PASTA domain-containing protein, partial [Clostridiaceae bacterium]|nr:PASTA domain-containing protein [Clostridiaceae bacterium]